MKRFLNWLCILVALEIYSFLLSEIALTIRGLFFPPHLDSEDWGGVFLIEIIMFLVIPIISLFISKDLNLYKKNGRKMNKKILWLIASIAIMWAILTPII